MRYKILFPFSKKSEYLKIKNHLTKKRNLVTFRVKCTIYKNLYMIPDKARHLHRRNHFHFIFENVFRDVELYTNAKLISLAPALK